MPSQPVSGIFSGQSGLKVYLRPFKGYLNFHPDCFPDLTPFFPVSWDFYAPQRPPLEAYAGTPSQLNSGKGVIEKIFSGRLGL